jgi:N utilization substance protein B
VTPRRQAREAALQILYFWEIGGAELDRAVTAFFDEHAQDASDTTRAFASEIARGTVADQPAIDGLISGEARHWRLERIAVIDRLILRMSIWELRHDRETPPAVVINEAIELARRFGTDESVRFVNGVLDGVRKTLDRH